MVRRFEQDPENNSAIIYELDSNTELAYLPTLDQHW